ncbi:DUF3828 domain-containing protein [Thermosynechococcus sp. PP42]|uniref:DUF3828 domain-containing protein n=1 Tax=unclassified Thermosynechococcus TaxID=2622553 RepID=UPI00285C7DC0|nr:MULTISPECIES: DUF3828 domain-containing protein [unclassified Thermosynechococcus]MDR5640296.1 DUF3828 domain-containing protein [Thermosynechococcus sp. PP42]MDR7994440.1 DUF3828 domain-containing protein [Thermosynechococcus sp. TG252]
MQWWLPLGVSLALVIETGAIASSAPETVVSQFYQWWVRNQDQGRQRFSQQRAAFTPDLYQQLIQAFRKQPRDGAWLDFDPFSFTQVSTQGVKVRNVRRSPNHPQVAEVDIEVMVGLRGRSGTPVPIKVLLRQGGDRWQIDNLIYLSTWDNLRCLLRDINR